MGWAGCLPAARVVAAARARVARARPLHHPPALRARRPELQEPDSFAGWTGGVSVSAEARGSARLRRSSRRCLCPTGCRRPERPFPAAGEHGLLGQLARADLGGEDAQLLLDVGVQEARGQPAHDVVGHRLGEGDLRVVGHPLRVEAHVGELAHERLERHAVLERDRDRRGERVHHAAQRRALLADVGEEDLADRAVLVHPGRDVALVAGDRELVGDRLALARHPPAERARASGVGRLLRIGVLLVLGVVRSACAVFEPSR